jgi:hypothetical protein
MDPSRLRRAVTAVLAIGALGVLPTTASASLIELDPCDDAELTQPFAQWGDGAFYKLAPGGSFEGDHGWTLRNGARIAADSEPHGVTGEVGRAALSLPAGASATSPATCVNAAYPSLRLFSRSSGGLLGLLPLVKVDLLYGEGLTKILPLPAGTMLPSRSWQPSLPMLTLSLVAGALADGETPLAIRITSLMGTWKVDDVFVDPFRRS